MKKKLIAFLSSMTLMIASVQGMLSSSAESDYKKYFINSDGIVYYQGYFPYTGKDDLDSVDTLWTTPPTIVEFSWAIEQIMCDEAPSTKMAVIIDPQCDPTSFEEDAAKFKEEHMINGKTYAEFESEVLKAMDEDPTWKEHKTGLEDLMKIQKEVTDYEWNLAKAEIEKEPERLEENGFEITKFTSGDIYTIATVEQLQNFVVNDKLGYKITLEFSRPPGVAPVVKSGDANGDGMFSAIDIVVLYKWLRGYGELPNWQNVDLNEDGIINIYDLILLKRKMIGK